MGGPRGKTRPQAQARRSTVQISAPELSAELEKIQSPEKRKNKKMRSAKRRAETAAIGEGNDSDYATLTSERDTMEVPTSDNEPKEKSRKRNRGLLPVAEEEDAAPAHEPRRRHRSQSTESLEETNYHGPQNETEHENAPTTPRNDADGQRTRARISKHQRKEARIEGQQYVQASIDLRAQQIARTEQEMAASLQETQAPVDASGNFFAASAGRPQS